MSAGVICVRSVQVASPKETVCVVTARMADARVGTMVVLHRLLARHATSCESPLKHEEED